jgi:hypothetical protein
MFEKPAVFEAWCAHLMLRIFSVGFDIHLRDFLLKSLANTRVHVATGALRPRAGPQRVPRGLKVSGVVA